MEEPPYFNCSTIMLFSDVKIAAWSEHLNECLAEKDFHLSQSTPINLNNELWPDQDFRIFMKIRQNKDSSKFYDNIIATVVVLKNFEKFL